MIICIYHTPTVDHQRRQQLEMNENPLETRQATKDAGAICGLNVLRCQNLVSLGIIVFPNVYPFDNNEAYESYV